MKRLFLVALCAVSILPAAGDSKAEQEVLAAMQSWKQAMMKKDPAALEKIFHADVTYAHSSGLIENRAEAIKHVSEGNVIYESIDFADTQVRVYGNMAIVTGKVKMSQSSNGKSNPVNLVVLHVFSKGPQGWKMIARQATRPTT